jgi:hypothetical protein
VGYWVVNLHPDLGVVTGLVRRSRAHGIAEFNPLASGSGRPHRLLYYCRLFFLHLPLITAEEAMEGPRHFRAHQSQPVQPSPRLSGSARCYSHHALRSPTRHRPSPAARAQQQRERVEPGEVSAAASISPRAQLTPQRWQRHPQTNQTTTSPPFRTASPEIPALLLSRRGAGRKPRGGRRRRRWRRDRCGSPR